MLKTPTSGLKNTILTDYRNCITDYFPTWRVPTIRKLADWANFLMIFVCGWGFYEFETNDVGVTEAVKRIWKA